MRAVPRQISVFGGAVDTGLETLRVELDAKRFQLMGLVLQLEWLEGPEADSAWAEYGWN